MFGMRCILFIFLVVCFFQVSLAIEVSFSAEDGGESVGISDDYEVGTDVSVSEESEAKFGSVEVTNTREVAGDGNVGMRQIYNGDKYTGWSLVGISGSQINAKNEARLTPTTLDASQSVSVPSNDNTYLYLGSVNNGNGAETVVWSYEGQVSTIQTIASDNKNANAMITGSLSGTNCHVETGAFWPVTETVDKIAQTSIGGNTNEVEYINIGNFNGAARAASESLESHQIVDSFKISGSPATNYGYIDTFYVDRNWLEGHWGTWSWSQTWWWSDTWSGSTNVGIGKVYFPPAGTVGSYDLSAMSYPPYCDITKTG